MKNRFDAHAFAASRASGFPINGSHAAIHGASLHRSSHSRMSNSRRKKKFFNSSDIFEKTSKFCKYCGTNVNIFANYCKNCGKKL